MAIPHLIADCQAGIKILTTPKLEPVTKLVAKILKEWSVPLDYSEEWVIETNRFSDGELCPTIETNVRDAVVYLFWDFSPENFDGKINERALELLLVLDALRNSKVKCVNLVLPYFPYARQDRKMKKRQPITARVFADMLEASDVIDQLITFDLHSPQITGFFKRISIENIAAHVIFAPFFRGEFSDEIGAKQLQIMSTDVGGAARARDCAEIIDPDLDIAIGDKRRRDGISKLMKIVGDINHTVVVYDDIGGTMGSLIDACDAALKNGASQVFGAITHNVCSPSGDTSAEKKLAEAGLTVYTLDTVPRGEKYYRRHKNIIPVPYHSFIAAAILEMITVNGSLSTLRSSWVENN